MGRSSLEAHTVHAGHYELEWVILSVQFVLYSFDKFLNQTAHVPQKLSRYSKFFYTKNVYSKWSWFYRINKWFFKDNFTVLPKVQISLGTEYLFFFCRRNGRLEKCLDSSADNDMVVQLNIMSFRRKCDFLAADQRQIRGGYEAALPWFKSLFQKSYQPSLELRILGPTHHLWYPLMASDAREVLLNEWPQRNFIENSSAVDVCKGKRVSPVSIISCRSLSHLHSRFVFLKSFKSHILASREFQVVRKPRNTFHFWIFAFRSWLRPQREVIARLVYELAAAYTLHELLPLPQSRILRTGSSLLIHVRTYIGKQYNISLAHDFMCLREEEKVTPELSCDRRGARECVNSERIEKL